MAEVLSSSGRSYTRKPVVQVRQETTTKALLIWAYQRQMVHILSDRGMWEQEAAFADEPFHQRSGDGCARLAEIGNIGCEIDGGGGVAQRATVHPDADLVHAYLGGGESGWAAERLLVDFGKTGMAPRWDIAQHWEPIWEHGHAAVREFDTAIVRYGSGAVRAVPVRYCPIQLYPASEFIDLARGEYSAWYEGLANLTDRLQDAPFKLWKVVGIGAKPHPWKK